MFDGLKDEILIDNINELNISRKHNMGRYVTGRKESIKISSITCNDIVEWLYYH